MELSSCFIMLGMWLEFLFMELGSCFIMLGMWLEFLFMYHSINKRISLLSSNMQSFQESASTYYNALRHSNFNHTIEWTQICFKF